MDVALHAGDAVELEDRLAAAARDRLNMSAWLVSGEDPYERPPLETRNLILQSPQSSVVIHVRTSNRREHARITVERTCISDALEPWRPYWQGVRTILREQGYTSTPR